MVKRVAVIALFALAVAAAASAQARKPAGTKSVTHDITIKLDDVYTGTMELTIDRGKVTGNMRLTKPTEITGKVAGTSKAGVLALEFPYHMTERNCDGTVSMNIKMPPKSGLGTGTLEVLSCGDPSRKLTGTVELRPAAKKGS